MAGTFNLPDVGEGLTEAEIVSWRVAVGDVVDINDIVVEIETAKSLVELPVPFAGEIRELLAAEGETIQVGSPLIRIAEAGSDPDEDTDTADAGEEKTTASSPTEQETPSGTETPTSAKTPPSTESAEDKALVGSGPKADSAKRRRRTRPTELDLVEAPGMGSPAADRQASGPVDDQAGAAADLLRRTTPPVRALAHRLGVALSELRPIGPGPVTREDVERLAAQPGRQGAASRNGTWAAAGGATAAPLLREGPREEEVQVRGVRKHTAINVSESAREVPHISVFREVDVTATMELRKALRADPRYEKLSVSPLLFVAKAIIWASRRNPQVNASWHSETYTLKNYLNLGIAAATPRGLVVPVITDAQTYDTHGLASAITELTHTAREGRTSPAQMQGGTISITNLGPLGIDAGTPILPPGQSAIVAVGAVRRKPWVVQEQIVPRDVMTIGGSFDHRLIDGEHAGHFLADVARVLEQPGLLLD